MQYTQVITKLSTRIQAVARTDVFRIAAKPPSLQPTSQPTDVPRLTAMSPSHQHKPPELLTNQPIRSTNEAFLNVQNDVLQLQCIIKDDNKSITPLWLGNNKKAFPRSKVPDLM